MIRARPTRATPTARWTWLIVVAVAACTPGATSNGDDDEAADPEQVAPATVTVPPQRLTPFCQEMIDLSDRLERDPPDDVGAEIIGTYERIQDEVPEEIRADFDAVLADLRGDPGSSAVDTTPETSTTTAPAGPPPTDETGATVPPADLSFDESFQPDDDPAARLNSYVDFECRGVQNNPGPPATQPLSETTVAES